MKYSIVFVVVVVIIIIIIIIIINFSLFVSLSLPVFACSKQTLCITIGNFQWLFLQVTSLHQ